MADKRPHVVVLGAGPAGLGAAFKLRQTDRARVTVIERRDRVGGNAASFEVGGQHVDLGSHRLHPSCDPEILDDVRSLLGADLLERPRHGRIRLRGQWIHFPPRPFDLLLRLDRRFALGAMRDMLMGNRARRSSSEPESFASVLRAQLGPTICDQFYLPYAGKIWGRDPRRLSALQAKRRVTAGTFGKLLRKVFGGLPGVKPVGFDYYFYPRSGFGQISEAMAQGAMDADAHLVLDEPVVRLEAPRDSRTTWTVVTEKDHGQQSFEADRVWSTIPISLLARLLRPAPPPEVLAATQAIEFRAMILVYLQLAVDQFSEFDAHYFPGRSLVITRLSEPKNYSASTEPKGSTVLCIEIPCSTSDPLWQMSTSELAEVVIGDLERAALPLPVEPHHVEVRRLPQAYPIYDLGFEEPLQRLEAWLTGLPGFLTFGRQGLFVHDNTHHALFMAYCAVDCLADGEWNSDKWEGYCRIFETHVVED